jgi:hypothetical protein
MKILCVGFPWMVRGTNITLSLPQLACIFLPQEMLPLGTDQKLHLPAASRFTSQVQVISKYVYI